MWARPTWLSKLTSPEPRTPYTKIGLTRFSVPLRLEPQAYALEAGAWREIGRFSGSERVSVAPFAQIAIDLRNLG
jgi:hypothetical protein